MSAVSEWLALLRVQEGGVVIRDGEYLNHGRPVAGYLAVAFDELLRTGHLALGRVAPGGHQQMCVTTALIRPNCAPRWWHACRRFTVTPEGQQITLH